MPTHAELKKVATMALHKLFTAAGAQPEADGAEGLAYVAQRAEAAVEQGDTGAAMAVQVTLESLIGCTTSKALCEPAQAAVDALHAWVQAEEYMVGVAAEEVQAAMRMPPLGTRAYEARLLVECGAMTGEEADRYKDEMKDKDMGM